MGRAYTRVGQHAHLSFIPFPPFQIVRVGLWEGRGGKGWENEGDRGYFSDVQGSIMQIGNGWLEEFGGFRCQRFQDAY